MGMLRTTLAFACLQIVQGLCTQRLIPQMLIGCINRIGRAAHKSWLSCLGRCLQCMYVPLRCTERMPMEDIVDFVRAAEGLFVQAGISLARASCIVAFILYWRGRKVRIHVAKDSLLEQLPRSIGDTALVDFLEDIGEHT